MASRGERARIRWWPAALILALAGALLAWQLARPAQTEQLRVIAIATILGLAGIALGLWWLLLSRAEPRLRARVAGAALALGLLAAVLVRIRGVTGDLVPVLEWRFAARAQPELPNAAPPSSAREASVDPSWRDFPQFLGPARDGRIEGVRLERDWTAHPPRTLWRRPVGAGWSGFAVAGADAITAEQRGEREAIVCYDRLTGAERWAHEHVARYETTLGGLGPRATPTIAAERVFALGATGLLDALERRTGRLLWERDILAENGAQNLPWGASASPLVLGELVIVPAGGSSGRSLVAYEAASGERRWSTGDDGAAYASPVLAELAGVPQVLSFNNGSLSAHDPASGALLWSQPWTATNPNVSQPLALDGDSVILSTGYGIGWARYRVARDQTGRWSLAEQWKSLALKSKFANFVLHEGHVYGFDDGILACLDSASGRRVWKGGRYGHGQLLLVDDLLLVMSEAGDLVLVEAGPTELRELARLPVFSDKTWNPPAFAPPHLFLRNDREAVCLELPLADPSREDSSESADH